MEIEKIFNNLNILINNSYSPYSNFKVAAIVEGEDEKFYQGVNIENASLGATICAERSAISSCIPSGNKSIKIVYLLTDMHRFIDIWEFAYNVFQYFWAQMVQFISLQKITDISKITYLN